VLSAETFRRDGDADADWEAPFGLFRLIELHAYFRELGRPERRLLLALRVAAGEGAPTDDRELAELKSALRAVLALQRSGRGPRRRPPGLRSIVIPGRAAASSDSGEPPPLYSTPPEPSSGYPKPLVRKQKR
jgi:hypothetical protein